MKNSKKVYVYNALLSKQNTVVKEKIQLRMGRRSQFYMESQEGGASFVGI